MAEPPTGPSAHVDTFARDSLPPRDQWPVMLYDRPELRYGTPLNVVGELLDKPVAAGHGGRPLLRMPGRDWSYGEVLERANRIAEVLTGELGLVPGNRVLLRGPNNPMMAACWLGIVKAGGIVVATMPLLRAPELATIASKARIALALCDSRLDGEMEAAMAACPELRRAVYFDGPTLDGASELEALMATKNGRFKTVPTAPDDVCLIAFTSGTTGKPKGTLHFHRDLLASADTFFAQCLPCDQKDVFCGSPPLAFTFGLGMQLIFPLHCGGSVAYLEQPAPEALLEAIERAGVTVLSTAPTAYRALLPLLAGHDLSGLKYCVSAGETLPLPTWRAWFDASGHKIIDGIGATEMFHIFITATGDDIRPGATGKPAPGYQAMVVDEQMTPLPAGETGLLAVRGPTGCRYLDDERQTSYVKQGWNLTGDTYRMDEDGYFWFQARADDMIISAGYNIAGPEVEAALLAHDAVAECAVVGEPDPQRGQIVKAFVVLAGGYTGDDAMTKTLQDFVKQTIAPYKYPRAISFCAALPKTETGKIQRFKLRH
jgi:2-aminobenzoate-CoA ligase